MTTELRQAELVRGRIHLVTWIPKEICRRNKELIDRSGQRWSVLHAYTITVESDEIRQDWKVGGLG